MRRPALCPNLSTNNAPPLPQAKVGLRGGRTSVQVEKLQENRAREKLLTSDPTPPFCEKRKGGVIRITEQQPRRARPKRSGTRHAASVGAANWRNLD